MANQSLRNQNSNYFCKFIRKNQGSLSFRHQGKEKLIGSSITNDSNVNEYRQLHLLYSIFDGKPELAEDNDLSTCWNIAFMASQRISNDLKQKNAKRCVRSVSKYVSALSEKRAYRQALRFIDVCEKVSNFNKPVLDLLFERARLLKANKDLSMATLLFKKILKIKDESIGSETTLLKFTIEAHSELSELAQNNDQAYSHLKSVYLHCYDKFLGGYII